MTLCTAVNSLKSLKSFVESKRTTFESYETAGKELSDEQEYESVRVRSASVRLRPLDYGTADVVQQSPRDIFRTKSFLPVIDQLIVLMNERISAYEDVDERFGFLAEMITMEPSQLEPKAKNLVHQYRDDLDLNLANKLIHLATFAKHYEKKKGESNKIFLYRIILQNNVQSTFCNAEVELRIYLSMMVTNCSGERSFSKLKIIKNRLRTSMT